jgi:hypothetical protein
MSDRLGWAGRPPLPEFKAVRPLMLARRVAGEVDELRTQLKVPGLPPPVRCRHEADLASSLERLLNLIVLAKSKLTAGTDARQSFQSALDDVLGRLFQLTIDHMLGQLRDLHRQAETALNSHVYPLGLAARLKQDYASTLANLSALGGLRRLREEERRQFEQIAHDMRTLAVIEATLFELVDFDAV